MVKKKFDFKKFQSKGVVGFDTFDPKEMTIWYEKGKFTIVQWGKNTPFYFSYQDLRVKLEFVHDLQNLYHDLEKQELTVKQ